MRDTVRQSNPLSVLFDEVLRTQGRLRSVFAGVSAATGLTSMEATVLTAIVEARFAPTVPQIGRSLGHPRQVIQRAATSLIAAGLIETRNNPDHKRAPLLVATAGGVALKDDADQRARKAADALLKHIDVTECLRMADDLRKLRGVLEEYAKSAR
jgi:DNA-binding MarR family transcriptional regulator